MTHFLKVCTKAGWQTVAFQDSLCQLNVPRMNHQAFQSATFGILLQFNGNTIVNLNNASTNITNMTTGNWSEDFMHFFIMTVKQKLRDSHTSFFYLSDYETNGGRNTTQYVKGIMGQALQLKGSEFINLHGIPRGFWSGDEYSVMGLIKFHDDALPANKDAAVLGDGGTRKNRGLHLGLRQQVSAFIG